MPILTDQAIRAADPPTKGQRLIFDSHRDAPRGFGLRITSAGGRAFILRYTAQGRERRKTIGPYGKWTLKAARAAAMEMAVAIERGEDPLAEKEARRAAPTVADVAEGFIERHVSGLKSRLTVEGLIRNDLIPELGRMKIADVRRVDVIEMVEKKAKVAPRAASMLLLYCKRVFSFAADRDLIDADPVAGIKPGAITVKGKRAPLAPRKRSRILDQEEIRAFWNSVETCGILRRTAIAMKLVLLLGQRPGEIAGMHEGEIDGRWWTIPASRRGKTSSAHAVYLTDTALDLIDAARHETARQRRRRREVAQGFVFESLPGKPLTAHALSRAVLRYSDALGAKDAAEGRWTPHDMRRTMRTGLSACRIRPDIAELAIGHERKGIIAVYDHHTFQPEKRAAFEAWEGRLLAIVDGRDPDEEFSDNVVHLERAQ